ncbi:MAG TPA: radical SAM family heme chaperone HemW [Thermoanaerobaculia bacterium]|nr:radical SAM family heme chaperone HemW [Thermoanaerobaculia bacterium]
MTTRPGAYVHVPYCAHRCSYCSFVAVTGRETEREYFDAVVAEIGARAGEVPGPLETVYLGGGTPSFADPGSLARVLGALERTWGLVADAEVTAEANPDDLVPERLDALVRLGVNRLSVGVQSLRDAELAPLERRHDAASARDAVRLALNRGLRVSADLMIGIPGQTRESLLEGLSELLSSGVGHVSVYLLEIEKAPRLVALRDSAPSLFAADDEMAERWERVDDACRAAGLPRYETSNWARPGEESRHNLKYWRREPVVAFGVSAASFDGLVRRTNGGSIPAYVAAVRATGTAFVAEERLPSEAALREEVLLGLRTVVGVAAGRFTEAVDTLPPADRARLSDAAAAGLLETESGRVRLTRAGVLLSNEVFALLL